MLRVDVLAVGTRAPVWVQQGVDEYAKRLGRDVNFNTVEIKVADRKKKQPVDTYQEEEGKGLLAKVDSGARVVALDRSGKSWSTEQLAEKLEDWSQLTNHLQFMIGGPDGLAKKCLEASDDVWSLSSLTFPHFLVRVLLAEQIYRAMMINAHHPYHK